MLTPKEIKFQQLSKMVNELPLDKKAKIVKKLLQNLDSNSILEVKEIANNCLPKAEKREIHKKIIKEKIAQGLISLNPDLDLDAIELLRIQIKPAKPGDKNGDRYCYLRGKVEGEQLAIYLGLKSLFSDCLHEIE